jgi:hypothetical protein
MFVVAKEFSEDIHSPEYVCLTSARTDKMTAIQMLSVLILIVAFYAPVLPTFLISRLCQTSNLEENVPNQLMSV